MSRLVWVALGPSVDLTFVVDELRLGGISRPASSVAVAGGKGFNAGRVAHALGATSTCAGVVGGPSGSWLAGELAAEGVDAVLVPGGAPTRVCVSIAHDARRLTELYPAAVSCTPSQWSALADAVRAAAGAWVLLCGSASDEPATPDGVHEVVAAARTAGALVGVDSHGAALAAALAAGADLLKVNAAEAREVTGTDGPAGASEVLAALPGLRVAVVTDGARGASLAARTPAGHVRLTAGAPVLERARFTVGSGDAFFGGFMTALTLPSARADPLGAGSLATALAAGVGAGAANALLPGAGRLEPDVARALARAVVVSTSPAGAS